jgi:hypothetical protein
MNKFMAALLLLVCVHAQAQKPAGANAQYLQTQEKALQAYSAQMVFDTVVVNRFAADSAFIKTLVKALRTPFSFGYPFDSVKTVSKIYPPDSSFRIFTWELQRDESYFRQQGFIQIKTTDGSLKMYPLFDVSDYGGALTDSLRGPRNWVGALYYGMVLKEYQGKKYYTLFGLDDNDFITTRKWIDILTFDPNTGQPQFGAPIFDYKDDSIKAPQPAWRFLMEFKKDASARMVYDPALDMIIFDHLVSESGKLWQRQTLIPDGDYEGFKWSNGKWTHVSKVFNQQLQDGQAPAPKPFYDANGKPLQPVQ